MESAIVFDLDDTLYPERRFILSGLAAVARHVDERFGVPCDRVFRYLAGELRRGRRPGVLQAACARFDLPADAVGGLIEVIRSHAPRLRLPAASRDALDALRGRWRTAILTNGQPDVQARKIAALGVDRLVDTVVYAQEHGRGAGKPDPVPFRVALERLGAAAACSVFVGNDPWCDIVGARGVGMATIRLRRDPHRWAPVARANDADVLVDSLRDVPRWALALIDRRRAHAG